MEQQDQNSSGAPQIMSSREELEQHLRARVWMDEAFRQEFLANPRAVLERDYAGWFPEGKIPSELSIKVVEEEEQALCFVLPPRAPDVLPEIEEIEEMASQVMGGSCTNGNISCAPVTYGSDCITYHTGCATRCGCRRWNGLVGKLKL